MKILITGVSAITKDTIVRMALDRFGSKAKYKLLSFSDFVEEMDNPLEEISMLKNTQKKITDNIQLRLIKAGADDHIVINGYCTVCTHLGFFPVISGEGIDVLKPDVIVSIEVDPAIMSGKLKNRAEFMEHQSVEKFCALNLATTAGCCIKIINSGRDSSRKGANELFTLLKDILVKK